MNEGKCTTPGWGKCTTPGCDGWGLHETHAYTTSGIVRLNEDLMTVTNDADTNKPTPEPPRTRRPRAEPEEPEPSLSDMHVARAEESRVDAVESRPWLRKDAQADALIYIGDCLLALVERLSELDQ